MNVEKSSIVSSKDAVQSWAADLKVHEQRRLARVYEVGEFTPYDKNKPPLKWDAFQDASYEWFSNPAEFIRNIGTHMRNIDTDFRGRDIGGAGERMERVAALSAIIAVFTAFDYATSKPFEKLLPVDKRDPDTLPPDILRRNAWNGAINKLIDVMNDKYATALGNMYVERLTGKRGYIHEVADKGADTLQDGWSGTKDIVNGATLESYMRIVSQLPVAGALFERGMTNLSMWQERSALHTATGKMIYMALGAFTKFSRIAAKKEPDLTPADVIGMLARWRA